MTIKKEILSRSPNKKHVLFSLAALTMVIVFLIIGYRIIYHSKHLNHTPEKIKIVCQIQRPKVVLWSLNGRKPKLYLQKGKLIKRIEGEYVSSKGTAELRLADWKPEGSGKYALCLDLPGKEYTQNYSYDQNTLEPVDYPLYHVKKSQTTLYSKRCFDSIFFDDLYLKNSDKLGKVDYPYYSSWSDIVEADLDHDGSNELILSLSLGHGTGWSPRFLAAYRTDTLEEIPVKDQLLRRDNNSSFLTEHIHPTVSEKGVVIDVDGQLTFISSKDMYHEIEPGAIVVVDTDVIDFYVRDGILFGQSAIFLRNPSDCVDVNVGSAEVTYDYRNGYIVHKNIRFER